MMKKFFDVLMELCVITFIIELILGFNGRLLILGKIPIREILFGLVTLGLVIKMLIAVKDNTYPSKDNIFNEKEINVYE